MKESFELRKVDLEQATRCMVVLFAANIPGALWGPVGIGKSSIVRQICDQVGYKLYDVRLSDKEPSDLGGVPFPNHELQRVTYYLPDLLPFKALVGDEKCVLLLDEVDRCDLAVQNVSLQLTLDRRLNGHELSPHCRIMLAGNGITDIGTTPLSAAAANRVCHLYIDNYSEGALNSFLKWAKDTGQPEELQSFARYRRDVFDGDPEKAPKVKELAIPTRRSFEFAARVYQTCQAMNFDTGDIEFQLVSGCIGSGAAADFLGWCKTFRDAPTIEAIIADPNGTDVPAEVDTMYAFGRTLVSYSKDHPEAADAFTRYIARFPREQASACFTKMLEVCPTASTSDGYRKWVKSQKVNV